MSTTSEFLKLRSSDNPKVGEWNYDFNKALELAKKEGKFIITSWSNGDLCSHCVTAEKCLMNDTFKNWMKTSNAYFVFLYSGDKNSGLLVYNWIFKEGLGPIKYYPGFRITLYKDNKIVSDTKIDGDNLRDKKINAYGAKAMVDNLTKIISKGSSANTLDKVTPTDKVTPAKVEYKIRFNEKISVKKVNAVLDSIDKNKGYCPCLVKSADTKCHCKDFVNNKKIGEPCICKIYVKLKK